MSFVRQVEIQRIVPFVSRVWVGFLQIMFEH